MTAADLRQAALEPTPYDTGEVAMRCVHIEARDLRQGDLIRTSTFPPYREAAVTSVEADDETIVITYQGVLGRPQVIDCSYDTLIGVVSLVDMLDPPSVDAATTTEEAA